MLWGNSSFPFLMEGIIPSIKNGKLELPHDMQQPVVLLE